MQSFSLNSVLIYQTFGITFCLLLIISPIVNLCVNLYVNEFMGLTTFESIHKNTTALHTAHGNE